MASPNSVKILEETRVAPSSNSPNSDKEMSLSLTFFDMFWLKHPRLECVYFYELSEFDSIPSTFNSEVLPRLKQSLSLAVVHFLPLAGNLTWPSDSPKPIILYTPNDSVPLTIAESNAENFNILSANDTYQANLLCPFLPAELKMIADDIAPIMSLQITFFPHQGFSIGTSSHHVVVDGKVATMFMKSWAYLFKHGDEAASLSLPPEIIPDFDRSAIKDPTRLDMIYLNDWITLTGSGNERNLRPLQKIIPNDEIVRATFGFTQEDIKKLREKVLLKVDGDLTKPQPHLSTFVLSLAYAITCIVKAKGGEEARPSIVVSFNVDCRTRLDPPLPPTYFGSGVMPFRSSNFTASSCMDQDGFFFIVHLLSNMVQGLTKGVLDGADEKLSARFAASKEPGLQAIYVAGSPQLKFYESDFGLGRLKKVQLAVIGGVISLIDSPDVRGGVELSLTLKNQEMENFATIFSKGL